MPSFCVFSLQAKVCKRGLAKRELKLGQNRRAFMQVMSLNLTKQRQDVFMAPSGSCYSRSSLKELSKIYGANLGGMQINREAGKSGFSCSGLKGWIYGTFQTFAALAPTAGICAVRLRREAGVGVQAPFYVPISIGFLEKVGACIVLEVA